MNRFGEVIEDIHNIIDREMAKKGVKIMFGTVLRTNPLQIRLDNNIEIDEGALYPSELCQNQRFQFQMTTETPITAQSSIGTVTIPAGATFTVQAQELNGALHVGQRVMLQNCNENQRYYIIQPISSLENH